MKASSYSFSNRTAFLSIKLSVHFGRDWLNVAASFQAASTLCMDAFMLRVRQVETMVSEVRADALSKRTNREPRSAGVFACSKSSGTFIKR